MSQTNSSDDTKPQADFNSGVAVRELTPSELDERLRITGCARPKPGRLEAAMATLRREGWLPWNIWPELTSSKDEFIPQVLEIFDTIDPIDSKRRMKTAGYLARLGVSVGHDFIVSYLRNPDAQLRWMALLNWDVQNAPPRSEAEKELLLSLLHDTDPRIRSNAIQACGIIAVDGFIPAFEILLPADDCPDRGRIVYWLLSQDCSEKHLAMGMDFLNRCETSEDTFWSLTGLHTVVKNGHSLLSAQARTAIEDFFLDSENPHKCNQQNVLLFGEIATDRALPALESILEKATDRVSQCLALNAIARLKPSLAVERLAPRLECHSLSRSFLRPFAISASEQDWSALVRLVLDALAADRTNAHLGFSDSVVELLLEHGGEAGRSLVMTALPELPPMIRMRALWKLNGWTIEDVLRGLGDFGLTEEVPDCALIERLRREQTTPVEDADLFYEVVRAAKILREVDSEAEDRPPDHCDLLAEYSEITTGVFAPRLCRQVLATRPVEDPEFKAKLNEQRIAKSQNPLPLEEEFNQVSFVVGNRLFEFEAFVSHRYYDIVATEAAVNAALEHGANPKRLVKVPSEDGFNLYFFAAPEKIRQFCAAYGIPFYDNLVQP